MTVSNRIRRPTKTSCTIVPTLERILSPFHAYCDLSEYSIPIVTDIMYTDSAFLKICGRDRFSGLRNSKVMDGRY